MAQTYQDFLGVGGTGVAAPLQPLKRATSPDGLTYLDDGSPTPLYYFRQQGLQTQPGQTARTYYDPTSAPDPTRPGNSYAGRGGPIEAAGGGVPATGVPIGRNLDLTFDPARQQRASETPIFTANIAPGAKQTGVFGAPVATGRALTLSAGDPAQSQPGQRIGTAAEAAQGNANYLATGSSIRSAGGGASALNPGASQAAATSARGAAESAGMGANVARVQAIGQQYADQNAATGAALTAQGAASANRAAPQIAAPSSANQQNALNAATNFQANTSGVAGIRNAVANTSGVAGIRGATADTSGAAALSTFRGDTQGISNLDRFQAENTQQGVNRLNAFQPTSTQQGVDSLQSFRADNTAEGIAALNQFRATNGDQGIAGLQSHSVAGTLQGAQDLQDFRTSTSGINNLNQYANEAQGPSRAEALLRSQSDQDKRTAIALARSARGGPAAIAQAMRQAQSEGAAIAAETRGQAAALSAQEFDTYKQRQLASLQAAGQLISNADAQRLQALSDAGQLLSNADQQKLAAFQSIAQARTAQDAQMLSAKVASGQLGASIDAQNLQARTAAGQLQSNMDQQRLGASTAAGQLQSNMDQQRLGATTAAGQLRLGNDTNRVNALQSAASINLEGSRINQQGQIAATNAELQGSAINQAGQIAATQAELAGSAQKLQALSLQGQISSDIRGQDIDVLKSNLSASLQQMNLNDTQVRAFAQMSQDATIAGQNLNMQAQQLGINAEAAQRQLALQWDQFAQSQLTDAQQLDYQNRALAQGLAVNQSASKTAQNNRREDQILGGLGTLLTIASDERAKKDIRPVNMAKALRDSPGSEYSYKDEKHGRGKFVGPMAQGLQKSKVFAGSVIDDKSGTLKVDSSRLVLTHHAALSHLQKEIDSIKRLRKPKKEARA